VTALAAVVDHIDQVGRRVIREAILSAEAAHFDRRAEMLEWARPKAGDWHGRATREELRERYDRLTEEARACRNRARVSLIGGSWPEIDDVIAEALG
jgi:hypothetical protein